MTLDNLVDNDSDTNYKTIIGNSKREAALLEVDRRYESVISSNRAYKIDEVSAGIEDLYKIAHGIYFRTNIHGKPVRVTRKVDRATVAAQKVRNLGDVVSSAVTQCALSSEEAREVLSHAREILDTTFSEKSQLSGKIGVHKRDYLNETYKPDNPFAYLRAARGKITRTSKKTQSFQYSGVPSSMFILEEGVKTYYSFDNERIMSAQITNSRLQLTVKLKQKVSRYSEPPAELVVLSTKKSDSLPESQGWVPDVFYDHDLMKRQNGLGWTDRDDSHKSRYRSKHKFIISHISLRGALDFFAPMNDTGLGSRDEPRRRPIWSRVLTTVWLTALLGTFAVEAPYGFARLTNSHKNIKSYEVIQQPILSPESLPLLSNAVFSHNSNFSF